MKRWLLSLGLIALAGVGCGPKGENAEGGGKRRGDQVPMVEVAPVARQSIAGQVHASGAIEAFETIEVSARVAGILDRLLVSEGDRVEPGAPLAEIDGERYRLALASAEAQRARAQAALEDATLGLSRRQDLAKDGMVAAEVLDQSRIRLAQAQADLAVAVAAADRARLDLRDATVLAPLGGVIQARRAVTGGYLQVGAPLVTLVQRDPMQVRCYITVAEASLLAPGLKVSIRLRDRATVLPGTIRLVAGAADPGTRLVAVIARLDAADAKVWPGAFAEVVIDLPARSGIVVPGLALRITENGILAYVVEQGKLVERRLEVAGHEADGAVEVLTGLTPGERLVVRGADGLAAGKPVRIAGEDAPESGKDRPRDSSTGVETTGSGSGDKPKKHHAAERPAAAP
jgi:multidrug efflux system membrane fusion protein